MEFIGSVTFRIALSSVDNCREGVEPEPLFMDVPRNAYLVAVLQAVRDAFGPFVPNFGRPLPVWLTHNSTLLGELIIPWHYHAGILHDMLRIRGKTKRCVALTARLSAAGPDAVPQGVPMCTAGCSSGAVDPTTSQLSGSRTTGDEQQRRERRETANALAMFTKQCVKATLAASFGTPKPFFILDPSSTGALCDLNVVIPEAAVADEAIQRFAKAHESLQRQYTPAQHAAARHVITLFDSRRDNFLSPTLVAVSKDSVVTFGDLVLSLCRLGHVRDYEAVESVDALAERARRAGHRFLVCGLEPPFECPLTDLLARFIGFDLRLGVAVVSAEQ